MKKPLMSQIAPGFFSFMLVILIYQYLCFQVLPGLYINFCIVNIDLKI